jgi:hypothetical protein
VLLFARVPTSEQMGLQKQNEKIKKLKKSFHEDSVVNFIKEIIIE